MATSTFSNTKALTRHIGKHFVRMVTLQEGPLEALERIRRDSHKIKQEVLRAAVGGDPKRAHRLTEQGRLAYNHGRYEDAREAFEDAIMADRTYAPAYMYLGRALHKLRNVDGAVQNLKMAIRLDPTSEAAAKARKKLLEIEPTGFGG